MRLSKSVALSFISILVADISMSAESMSQKENMLPLGIYQLSQHPALSTHAFLVSKESRLLQVYEPNGDSIRLVAEYPADIGKSDGDKTKANDHKTPEGIYFLETKLTQPHIPFDLYGSLAFTTNYPNVFDRQLNKTGSGIWLHAIPDTVPLTRGSRGCVVVRNDAIKKLSDYVVLERTPILIFDQVKFVSSKEHQARRQELSQFVAEWKKSWESQEIDKYMSFYDQSFKSQNMGWAAWKRYKTSLKKKYDFVKVEINQPSVFESKGQIVIKALQQYTSDGHSDFGQKIIYARQTSNGIKIIREDWSPLQDKVTAVNQQN
jgi:murein L,D-transpeptidase YafK